MVIKKRIEFNTDFGNKTKASATLHQGNNCDDANPVNVTISSNGHALTSFFRLRESRST